MGITWLIQGYAFGQSLAISTITEELSFIGIDHIMPRMALLDTDIAASAFVYKLAGIAMVPVLCLVILPSGHKGTLLSLLIYLFDLINLRF